MDLWERGAKRPLSPGRTCEEPFWPLNSWGTRSNVGVVNAATAVEPALVAGLRLAVLRLARRLRRHAEFGITPSQLSALASIDRLGPLPLGELATIENVRPSTVTQIVGVLETGLLVRRGTDKADRRIVPVEVTARGRRLLTVGRARSTGYLATRMAGLEQEELAALAAALPVLERLLEDEA